MPLLLYKCECGNAEKKFIRQAKDAPAAFLCNKCNSSEMKKQLSSPSSSTKISIDNGHMARAVEIIPDIIEINQERANKDYTEK